MFKQRLEAVSDGIFAIVMTLLVIEIKVPEMHAHFDELLFRESLLELKPVFLSFFLSFAILSYYWVNHNFLFTMMAKNVDRNLTYLNFLFLSFVSLIPFSAHLLGSYPESQSAVAIYSLNYLIIAIMSFVVREYVVRSPRIQNPDTKEFKLSAKDKLYGSVRIFSAVIFSVLALIFIPVNTYISIAFLLIPVILGAVPGLLGFILNITRLDRLAKEIEEI